jgi:uncharacterized protein (DUF58 family)
MTTAEIIQKVRRIEIKTKGLSNHIFAGEYHSAYKGRGMSFSEVREYTPGDDVKSIDWNVTARFSTPFVKVYEEERELTVMLLIDVSYSALFGTQLRTKKDLITEIAAVLSFAASTNNDKVGVIFFSDKVEQYIPPQKGKSHILRIIRSLITIEPKTFHASTNISVAIEYLNAVVKKKTITFLISDFITDNYEKQIMLAARKHDLVGVKVFDLHDKTLPNVGLIEVEDAETGFKTWIDTSDKDTRMQFEATFNQQEKYSNSVFKKSGAALIQIRTDQDYVKIMQGFFKNR